MRYYAPCGGGFVEIGPLTFLFMLPFLVAFLPIWALFRIIDWLSRR